jgi:hypothetical protein
MSKKKMTPAEVANQLGQFIAKQEETLRKYPVGPLANSARANLKKGRAALDALQAKNEEMRMAKMPQPAPQQMALGGPPAENLAVPASQSGFEISLRQYNPGNLMEGSGMLDKLDDERFATFPTLEAGWNALIRQLNKYAGKQGLKSTTGITGDSTLAEAMAKYAPKYENDTEGYIDTLATALGVTPDTKIKELDTKEWATAISRVEGPQGFAALDNAGLLDERIASQFRDSRAVQEALPIAERFTSTMPTIPENRDTTTYAQIFSQPAPTQEPAPAPAQTATIPPPNEVNNSSAAVAEPAVTEPSNLPSQPTDPLPELNNDMLYELALTDSNVARFMDRNNVSEQTLRDMIDGNYVDVPNRSALDQMIRKVASTYKSDKEVINTGVDKNQPPDDIGWSPATGITRERYKTLLAEADKKYPDQALFYQPGAGGKEGAFIPNVAAPLPAAEIATELPRDEQGRPIFTGMQAKINYDNFRALGEQGQREGIDMTTAVKAGRDQFARDYLQPTLFGGLGVAALAPGALPALGGSLLAPETAAALSNVGRSFLSNQIFNPAIAGGGINIAGATGLALTGAGMMKGGLDAVGARRPWDEPGMTRLNAYQVATSEDMTPMAKAEYFATLGIELAPAIFESPTMIRNLFRGRPSDFPGSFGSYLNARRAMINQADDAAALAAQTDDAFRVTQTNRQAFSQTAQKAEQRALTAEQKAAAKPTKANVDAAEKARVKAETAKANDAAALKNQQADNARRLNARGRAGVADEELAQFNQRYNAPAEPYTFGSTGVLSNTNNLVPAAVNQLGLLNNLATEPAVNTPETVRPVTLVQPDVRTGQIPDAIETVEDMGGSGDGGGSAGGSGVQSSIDPIQPPEEVAAPGVVPKTIQVEGSPDQVQLNMPGMNYLSAVPALASLASAGIQRRALNKMQAPNRPITTDIPQFAYESNIQRTLDDIRSATNSAARAGENVMPAQQAMANRQALLAERFRQEGRARSADNQQRQAAKQRYDAMAFQGRMAQDAIRNKYMDDMNAFNNQKAMLDAQIKQQPFNVLSASAQDYLKNVYAPNLAAMLEAQGRQYNTNIDTTGIYDPNTTNE